MVLITFEKQNVDGKPVYGENEQVKFSGSGFSILINREVNENTGTLVLTTEYIINNTQKCVLVL